MPHILDTYSLQCGLKHSKPYIYTKYYPLNVNKYITIHNSNKTPSKEYDYFNEVISIISPVLKLNNIDIIQIGTKNDKILNDVICLNGITNIGQTSYIISKSILHVGIDSAPVHIASVFSKKIVALYSNNYISVVKPYWSKKEDYILLEPDRVNRKPSFSSNEGPNKQINEIKPETIAESVLKLLGLEYNFPYKTLEFGSLYNSQTIEFIPECVIDPTSLNKIGINVNSLIARMDVKFDENILAQQLNIIPCSIITNKILSPNLILQYKSRIPEIVFEVTDNSCIEFITFLQKISIKYGLISYLPEDKLNDIKLDFMELGLINRLYINRDIQENLYYQSPKITLGKNGLFASIYDWSNNRLIKQHREIFPVLSIDDNFRKEYSLFRILKKIDNP